MPGRWDGSNRRDELPPDWPVIRVRILRRDDHQCVARVGPARCTEPATDVDHIGAKHDHRDENLRALCSWHHKRRSSAQGNAARRRVPEKRAPEPHPGLKGPS